jgi:hypothetical protein
MPHGIFQRISGVTGKVWIPTLGAHIGTISEWSLTMRGDEDQEADGLYDLRATFSYMNPHLWVDEDYAKEILVTIGKGRTAKQFRVQKASDEETVLVGRSLLMKGVSIHVG